MSQEAETVESLIRGPLIGTLVGLVLYGVTFLQAFFYFQTYVDDRMGLKLVVALLVILETAHAVLSVSVMDYYLIAHYGQVQVLQSATWVSMVMYIVVFTTDFVAYLYFTWRIWAFTKRVWIVIFMIFIAVSRTIISIVPSVWSVLSGTWNSYLVRSKRLFLAGNALFLFGDFFSACMMAYYLEKNRNGLRSTHTLINRILIFVVATGAIAVFVDIIALVLIIAQSESLAFTSAIFIQSRLYSNSLLASLNARKSHNRVLHDCGDRRSVPIELPQNSIRFAQQSDIRGGAALQRSQRTSGSTKSTQSWHTAPEVAA